MDWVRTIEALRSALPPRARVALLDCGPDRICLGLAERALSDVGLVIAPAASMPEAEGNAAPGEGVGAMTEADLLVEIARYLGREVASTAPLMHAGFNSKLAVEFASHLESLIGRRVPKTLLFDCPTARDICVFLGGAGKPRAAADRLLAAHQPRLQGEPSVVPVIRRVHNLQQLDGNSDRIVAAPLGRWGPEPANAGRVRFGGFLPAVADFDQQHFEASHLARLSFRPPPSPKSSSALQSCP